MSPGRAGHSLPELIVAVTLLATSAVAVAGMAVLGGRWTAGAVARQEAVRLAGAILDSVAAQPGATEGRLDVNGFRVRWSAGGEHPGDTPDLGDRSDPTAGGAGIRVVVSRVAGGPPLAVLWGRGLPSAPVLPDAGGMDSTAPAPMPRSGG